MRYIKSYKFFNEDATANASTAGMGSVSNAQTGSVSGMPGTIGSGDIEFYFKKERRKKGNPSQVTDLRDLKDVKTNKVKESNEYDNKTLINVDIQPEYKDWFGFDLYKWVDMVNNHNGQIVFLYNGEDTVGELGEMSYQIWLMDQGIDEDVIYRSRFFDKGYAFFRYCMDSYIDEDDIVGLVKMMVEYNIDDSRDLTPEFWDEFISRYGKENIRELLEFAGDCINIPELMDFLKSYNNIIICGGAKNQCLKEVEIALMALDKPYLKMDDFIYENIINESEAYNNIDEYRSEIIDQFKVYNIRPMVLNHLLDFYSSDIENGYENDKQPKEFVDGIVKDMGLGTGGYMSPQIKTSDMNRTIKYL